MKRMLNTYSHQAITTHHPRLFSLVALSVGTADVEKPQRFCLIASRELGERFDTSNGILYANLSDFIPRHGCGFIGSDSHEPVMKKY